MSSPHDRQQIRSIETRLNSYSYRPSLPKAKPAYLLDAKVFQLMPLDIGTIWGLQRSSFIGLLIGFEKAEIYEDLKDVEFALSEAVKSNIQAGEPIILPKREWIKLDIDEYRGVPLQKDRIIDVVVDQSKEAGNSFVENSFPDSSIPGFFFEIEVGQINTAYSEKIKDWCEALLNKLFPLQSVAIVIHIICSLNKDVYQEVRNLQDQLRKIDKKIPIELMRLDARLFFASNRSSQNTERASFINVQENPGLCFCSWMYWIYNNSTLSLEKEMKIYEDINNLYIKIKKQWQYSETVLRDTYSETMARNVVLDIKAIAPTMLGKVYDQLLHLIVNFFPQWSYAG
jgi:hypothetical protein